MIPLPKEDVTPPVTNTYLDFFIKNEGQNESLRDAKLRLKGPFSCFWPRETIQLVFNSPGAGDFSKPVCHDAPNARPGRPSTRPLSKIPAWDAAMPMPAK